MSEYETWVDRYNETHRTVTTPDTADEWEFDESPFAQLNLEWANEVRQSLSRPHIVHVNALHESRVQVGSMHLSSVPMQPQEIGRWLPWSQSLLT